MQLVKGVQLGHSEDCIEKGRKQNRDLGEFKSLLEGTVKARGEGEGWKNLKEGST